MSNDGLNDDPIPTLPEPTPFELGWLVGLFSGEGCITTKGTGSLQMSLSMTDEEEVRRFHVLIGCGRVYGTYESADGHKTHWEWKAQSREDVERAADLLVPWLCGRRWEQAKRVGLLDGALAGIEYEKE